MNLSLITFSQCKSQLQSGPAAAEDNSEDLFA